MSKIYYQTTRVGKFNYSNLYLSRGDMDLKIMEELGLINVNKHIRKVLRPAYLNKVFASGKLKPMRLQDMFWELQEEATEEYESESFWNYIARDGGIRC